MTGRQQAGSPGQQTSSSLGSGPLPSPALTSITDRVGPHHPSPSTTTTTSYTFRPSRALLGNVKVPSATPAGKVGGCHLPSLQKRTTWKKNLGSICRTRVEYHCWTLLHFQITLGTLARSSSTSDLIFLFLPCLPAWCPGWTNFTNIELYRL